LAPASERPAPPPTAAQRLLLLDAWRRSGLTIEENELVRPVHDRMPCILDPQHFERWLDPAEQDGEGVAPLLRPFAPDRMRAYPVSPWVNDLRHEDARCIEPAA
jgi:putative SOS response-associated peptidase YedK